MSRRHEPDWADTPTEAAYYRDQETRAEDDAADRRREAAEDAGFHMAADPDEDGEIMRAFRAVFGGGDR